MSSFSSIWMSDFLPYYNTYAYIFSSLLFFLFCCWKVLLWQASIATSPLVFVIATCIWSEEIIYLLVSCNKQLFSCICGARHLSDLFTFIFHSIQISHFSLFSFRVRARPGLPDLPLFAENFRFLTLFPQFFRNSAFWNFENVCS